MSISVTIMAHPSRHKFAYPLFSKLKKQGFKQVYIMYDMKNDEWNNGRASLLGHGESDWHIVIQDDAIISDKFFENVKRAIRHVPQPTIISFYTGTIRPRPTRVANAILKAQASQSNWLQAETLFWGVCIAIPTKTIEQVIAFADKRVSLKYDLRVGSYFKHLKLPVFYTHPSLVDHDHTIGSLIGNDYDRRPRVAHHYEPKVVKGWNKEVVAI